MLRDIPSSTLKKLVRLTERKEALMAQIQEIDREMVRVQNKFGIPSREGAQRAPVTVSGAPGGPLRRRSKRSDFPLLTVGRMPRLITPRCNSPSIRASAA